MSASQKSRAKDGLVQNPEQLANALAHVVLLEGGRETVLGQAWIAAPNRLITCGHVVEKYIKATSMLQVRFPHSGNKYVVIRIVLHPSFVRQPDQLVKFDVAMLELSLQLPESQAAPLPFSYAQGITTNQSLWAIRYPAHLGQISAAPQPLTQDGRYLGPLRTHDQFHLLHDLPLSPGDSGAPISDGKMIVAVHCGDTATLPGLNLPTTSIRLALWVDALRELGISETAVSTNKSKNSVWAPVLAFLISAVIVGACAYLYFVQQAKQTWSYQNPQLMPIEVAFNKPRDQYKLREDVETTITPAADYYLHLFAVDDQDDSIVLLFPQFGQKNLIHKGQPCLVSQLGRTKITATPSKCTCFLVAVRGDSKAAQDLEQKIVLSSDRSAPPEEGMPFAIKGKELKKRLNDLVASNADDVLFVRFPGVSSSN